MRFKFFICFKFILWFIITFKLNINILKNSHVKKLDKFSTSIVMFYYRYMNLIFLFIKKNYFVSISLNTTKFVVFHLPLLIIFGYTFLWLNVHNIIFNIICINMFIYIYIYTSLVFNKFIKLCSVTINICIFKFYIC